MNKDITVMEAAKRSNQRHALTASIASRFLDLDPESLGAGIETMLAEVGAFLDADRAYLYRFSENKRYAMLEQQWYVDAPAGQSPISERLVVADFPVLAGQITSRKNVVIPNLHVLDPEGSDVKILLQKGVKSLVNVPLVHRSHTIGFLGFSWVRRAHEPAEETVSFVSAIASVVAAALSRNQAELEVRRRLEVERVFSAISTRFLSSEGEDIRHVINAVLQIVGEFTGADRAFVFEPVRMGKFIRIAFNWYSPELDSVEEDGDIELYRSFWGVENLVVDDVLIVPRVAELMPGSKKASEILQKTEIKSLVVIALVVGAKKVGWFGLSSYLRECHWPDDVITLLKTVAGTLACFIEKRRAEEELRLSEVRFRTVVDTLPEAVIVTDLETKLSYCSPQALKLFGYDSVEQTQGKTFIDHIVPEEREYYYANIKRIFSEQVIYNIAHTLLKVDGQQFDGEISVALVRDNAGTPRSLVGVTRDVTLQKKESLQLKRQDRMFRDVVESSPVGVHFYALDENDRLIFDGANPAADQFLKVDNEHFIGMSIEEAFPALTGELLERYRRTAKDGEPWHTDQLTYKDDNIEGVFEIFAFQTRPGAAVAMFLDITARREAEAQKAQQRQDLSLMSRTAMDLIAFDFDDDIHDYIARCTHEFIGEFAVVVVTEHDAKKKRHAIKAVRGLSEEAEKEVRQNLAPTWTGAEELFPRPLKSSTEKSRIRCLEGGFAELSETLLPADVAYRIAGEHGHWTAHVVEFARSGTALGSAVIIQGRETPHPRHQMLDALAGQFSIALERRRVLRELARRTWELEILNTLSTFTGRLLDVGSYLDRVAEELACILGFGASIWLIKGNVNYQEKPRYQLAACHGHSQEWISHAIQITSMRELIPEGDPLDRLLRIVNLEKFPEGLAQCAQRSHMQTGFLVPIESGADVLGYLLSCTTPTSKQIFEHRSFFEMLGKQIGLGLRNAQLFREVDKHRLRLKHLADKITNTEEDQRRRTARDVHDHVSQPLSLVAMLLSADHTSKNLSNGGRIKATEYLSIALTELRRIILDLHPPVLDSFGVGVAVEDAAENLRSVANLDIETKITYRDMKESRSLRSFLLRAAKELMVNVVKHANATTILVTLSQRGEQLVLCVEDNGNGFDTTHAVDASPIPMGIGLIALEERCITFGGTFRVQSGLDQGTSVEICLPIRSRQSSPSLA